MGTRAADVVLHHGGHDVEVTWKNIRSMRLRVTAPEGRIKVSVPFHVEDETLYHFIDNHLDWIARAKQKVGLRPPIVESVADGGRTRLWGRWYEIGTQHGPRTAATLLGSAILLVGPDQAGLEKALEDLRRSEIRAALPALLAHWEPRIERSSSLIRLRRMTSRWGTCNTRTGAITLNTALAQWPVEALEYVLVHELVHLWEGNHGPGFTARMDHHLPDWRARRAALKAR